MNAGELKVNFGGLDAAAADIQASANQIEGRLDALESELAPLRSDWTGSASSSYQQAKAKFDAAPAFALPITAGDDADRARECLAAAIYYEAASEPIDGQRAVAQAERMGRAGRLSPRLPLREDCANV